jgi:hypothetical protein
MGLLKTKRCGLQMSGWKRVKIISRKKIGHVWLVRKNKRGHIHTGYFKTIPTKDEEYTGPLLGNELLASRLAKLFGLEAARVELAKIEDRVGIVSIVKPGKKLYRWGDLRTRVIRHLPDYLVDHEKLYRLFVFDIWICNVDRHSGNVIVYPVGKKYDFYLIDHGLSLAGALQWRQRPWYDSFWDHVARYKPRYLRGLKKELQSYRQVAPFVEQIKEIPAYVIEKEVDSIPSDLLSLAERKVMKKFLLHRKQNLDHIVHRWFEER